VLVVSDRPFPKDAELARLGDELAHQWADLHPPIEMEWPATTMVALDRGAPWLFGPAERDPLRDRKGRVYIPSDSRARLQELAKRGLPFRQVATAHELDPVGPVRELLPDLRHGPVACSDVAARRLVGPLPAHPGVSRAASVLDAVVGGIGLAVGGLADVILDPIVFGVVALRTPRPGDPTLWFPLVAWRW
jgi:hypothetical protein